MRPSSQEAGVGLALSSGGAASIAQIGVLERLIEAGVPIDVVAGTSAGAIIGAVLASGRLAEFRDALSTFTWRRSARLFNLVWPKESLLQFGPAIEFFRGFVSEQIEDLDKRFAAVAVDLTTGDEVVLRSGSVIDAIRASCAIPGLFPPHSQNGRWLVDGALVNPIPVNVARELGARITIAVNVLVADGADARRFTQACRTRERPTLRGQLASRLRWRPRRPAYDAIEAQGESDAAPTALQLFVVLGQATRIIQCQIAAARLQQEPPDVVVNVPVGVIGVFDFHRAAELIEAGRNSANRALPEIERALAESRPKPLIRRFVDSFQLPVFS